MLSTFSTIGLCCRHHHATPPGWEAVRCLPVPLYPCLLPLCQEQGQERRFARPSNPYACLGRCRLPPMPVLPAGLYACNSNPIPSHACWGSMPPFPPYVWGGHICYAYAMHLLHLLTCPYLLCPYLTTYIQQDGTGGGGTFFSLLLFLGGENTYGHWTGGFLLSIYTLSISIRHFLPSFYLYLFFFLSLCFTCLLSSLPSPLPGTGRGRKGTPLPTTLLTHSSFFHSL